MKNHRERRIYDAGFGEAWKIQNVREDFHHFFFHLVDDIEERGQEVGRLGLFFSKAWQTCHVIAQLKPGQARRRRANEAGRRNRLGPAVRPTSASNNESRSVRRRLPNDPLALTLRLPREEPLQRAYSLCSVVHTARGASGEWRRAVGVA